MTRPIVLIALTAPLVAADFFVEVGGSDTANDCRTEATPCATVPHAVRQGPSPGDTIRLGAGTHEVQGNDQIKLPPGVSLLGAGIDQTVITPAEPQDYYGSMVTVAGYDGAVRVADMTLDSAGNQTGFSAFGENLSVADLTVSRVKVVNAEFGFFVAMTFGDQRLTLDQLDVAGMTRESGMVQMFLGQGSVSLTDSTFSANRRGPLLIFGHEGKEPLGDTPRYEVVVTGNASTDHADAGLAIDVDEDVNARVFVADNVLTGNGPHGLGLRISDGCKAEFEVRDNTLTGNAGDGATLTFRQNNTVVGGFFGNVATDNGGAGFSIETERGGNLLDLLYEGNTATDNLGDGLATDFSNEDNGIDLALVNNTFSHNDRGVSVSADTFGTLDVDLSHNAIEANASDGVRLSCEFTNVIAGLYGNVITGNGQDGLRSVTVAAAATVLDLRHNDLRGNASGYTNPGFSDIALVFPRLDVLAFDNWFGSTDRNVIDGHILDALDPENGEGRVLYTALDDALSFTVAAPSVSAAGGTVRIDADEGTFFVPSAGSRALVVTFGGVPATDVHVAEDGRTLFATAPTHAPGLVDVVVTLPGGPTGTASGFEFVPADTSTTSGAGAADESEGRVDPFEDVPGAPAAATGCSTAPGPVSGLWGLALVLGFRRRR